ncbi:hypothetical protein NEQG_00890 [Nematocida parisii ERTm3]|uniref:Uncharacterized protein n=2 Tax=Nematocida parisii TaxID=586133 RepID=I3EIM4_NEMP3|nr:hypothetical protein NEQG_00890 [Nematocida parisii ERTm3]
MNMLLCINSDICKSINIVFNFMSYHRVNMDLLFLNHLLTDQIQSIWSVAELVQTYVISNSNYITNTNQKTKKDQSNKLNRAGHEVSNTEDEFFHETCDVIKDFSLATKSHERMNQDTFLNTTPDTRTAAVTNTPKELYVISPDVYNKADDKGEVPLITPQYEETDSNETIRMYAFTLETDKSETEHTIIDILINILILFVAVSVFWLLYTKILRRYL